MLKKLTTVAITTAGFLALAVPAFADTGLCPPTDSTFNSLCALDFNTNGTFGKIITVVFVIATLLALVYLIWGGIKWVLSGGDKTKVDAARAAIVASIVGLIIIFLSYFILNVVVGIFVPGFSLNSITLPNISQ